MKALHGPVSGDNILDGGGKKMSVVRQARRERRTIVEIVSRAAFRQFYLSKEGVDIAPSLEDDFLFLGEVDRHDD